MSSSTTLLPRTVAEFAGDIFGACMVISASRHTRTAYVADAKRWLTFCEANRLDPREVTPLVVASWVESMKRTKLAPKTRGRRLSALSSIYDRLRRDGRVDRNPFSPTDGPKRERVHAVKPTPVADAHAVAAAIRKCEEDETPEGLRDAAILRVLWATGARRSSLVEMTRERLTEDGASEGYTCGVPAKRGKSVRLWISGRAAVALRRWLDYLTERGVQAGAVFRVGTGAAMTEKEVWRVVRRRGKEVGARLSPHSFRVAFLTLCPASLEERQDAAGHSSPQTTRLYDRQWRGRAAFAAMPEAEDVT